MERHISGDKLAGVVTLLARDGQVFHHEAFGGLTRDGGAPMSTDAIFRLYSMTKPITCVALMTLYEQGHFQLTDPVSKFIPEFGHLKVAVEDGSDVTLVDLDEPVTIHQLLTHTTGLTYSFWEYGAVEERYRAARVSAGQTLADFVTGLAKLPLAFQPGTAWRYSFAHDVVARLVEVISGQDFDAYLSEHLFDRLGMVDTGFHVPRDKHHRFASMYGSGEVLGPDITGTRLFDDLDAGRNALIGGPVDSLESSPHKVLRGGHGLVSTATDYLAFCQMMLNGGELDGQRILGRKTVELMTANHLAPKLFPIEEGGLSKPGCGYGLGFGVMMDVGRSGTIGSNGEFYWSGAASTSFWIDPAERFIGIQLTQFQPMSAFPNAEDFRVAAYQAMIS
ncbi:MAG: beta-lactamase family protein [Rhodospirillaceae bacterium]|nr:beta-lactamase family protein [Rhodospirillaceae bacterium]